ncbi:unnamed protein product [Choristocarpus tenellus]
MTPLEVEKGTYIGRLISLTPLVNISKVHIFYSTVRGHTKTLYCKAPHPKSCWQVDRFRSRSQNGRPSQFHLVVNTDQPTSIQKMMHGKADPKCLYKCEIHTPLSPLRPSTPHA